MKMKPITPVVIIAAIVGLFVGRTFTKDYFASQQGYEIEEVLANAAQEVNAISPKVLDKTTRLDGAESGPGNRLTYIYTLTSIKASEVDSESWKRDSIPFIRNNIKNSEGMRHLFEIGVTVSYRYYGIDGEFVDEIVMTPEEVIER